MRKTSAASAFVHKKSAGIQSRKPDALVDIGDLRIARANIAGCRITDVVEQDRAGKRASIALILAAAIVVLLGVTDPGWTLRVVLGGSVLAIVIAVSLLEAVGATRTVLYRLEIIGSDGRSMQVTTADRNEAEMLADTVGPMRWADVEPAE